MNPKTIVLTTSSLAVFFIAFMTTGFTVALPAIGAEFGSDAVQLGWMVTSFILAIAVFSLPFGRIADIFGIKKVFIYGMILYTISSAAGMFSNSTITMIVFRSFQGITAGMIVSNSMAMVTAVYPANERGRVLGINMASVYTGQALGPFLGGVLTDHLGWRSLFLINIPAGLLVILLIVWKIKDEWCECRGEKFDYKGSTIYGIALVVLMYGLSLLPGLSGGILVLAGMVGLFGFIKFESKMKSPVLDVSVFRNNKTFLLSNLSGFIFYSAIWAVSFLLSLYLQYVKGFSPTLAGFILVTQPLIQAVLSPITGRLSDRIEPGKVASAGMCLTFLGLLSYVFLTDSTSIIQIVAALVVLGAGFALFASPNSNAIMSSVLPKYYGVASSTTGTTRAIGQLLSMGVSMMVISIMIGNVAISPEYYPAFLTSTRIVFGIFALFCFVGIFTSLSRGNVR